MDFISGQNIPYFSWDFDFKIWFQARQEPITRSVQLPYSVCETAFSQVGLFLDKPFPRISFQKPIRSECIINNKLLMRN